MQSALTTSKIEPITNHISKQIRSMFVFVCMAQMFAMIVTIGILTYKDAIRRAQFLATSNSQSIGMAISTGDLFQLKGVISSFKSEDTPYVHLLHEGKDVLSIAQDLASNDLGKESLITWEDGGILLRTDFPVTFNDIEYARLVLKNRLRINDWIILCAAILLTTLAFFFIQARMFEQFSLYLGNSINGIGGFFEHAKCENKLNEYRQNRDASTFTEVEAIAEKIHSVLAKIIRAHDAEKLSEKYKAIAKVTAHVAHDLRHPLSVFEAVSNTDNWNAFSQIKPELGKALARIENMIDGLRNTETSSLVRLTPNRILLGEVVAQILPLARDKGVVVRCEGSVSEIYCMMDQLKLFRALHNLIFNAIESGAKEIVLRCHLVEADCALEIIDNGPGIPDHFVSKLFTEGATFGKRGGTGIGLSAVKKIILSHRGSISYLRKDNLTTFLLKFPIIIDSSLFVQNVSDFDSSPKQAHVKPIAQAPKVFVSLQDKDLEKRILECLIVREIEILEEVTKLRSNDFIYTDDDDLVLLSMTKYRAMTMRHSSINNFAEIADIVAQKYQLKRDAARRRDVDP